MNSKIRSLIVALALGAASVGAVAAPALAQERGYGYDHGRDWHGHEGYRGGWYDRWHHFHPVPVYAAPYGPAYYPPPVVYAAPQPYAYAPPVASLNFVLPLRIR